MSIEELYEILLSKNPREAIIQNEEKIFEMIPELKTCKGFNQNNIWHPYDVYQHILHVVDNVEKDICLRLAALFHDIGKPQTYTEDSKGVGHFYGHWDKSAEIFNEFAKKYKIDNNIKDTVEILIKYHDKNLEYMNDRELKLFTDMFYRREIIMLFKLKKADLLAQNEKFHGLLEQYEKQKNRVLLKY